MQTAVRSDDTTMDDHEAPGMAEKVAGHDYIRSNLPLSVYEGSYENQEYIKSGGGNDWHYVDITKKSENELTWTNRAGLSWTLTKTDDPTKFSVGEDCVYYKHGYREAIFTFQGGLFTQVLGPWNQPYIRNNLPLRVT